MDAPTPPNAAPAPGMTVILKSTIKAGPRGTLVVAKVDCEQLGADGAYLVVNPTDNLVSLVAPCGCHVGVELSRLILSLADAMGKADHGLAVDEAAALTAEQDADAARAAAPVGLVH